MKRPCFALLSSLTLLLPTAALASNDAAPTIEFNAPPVASHQLSDTLWFGADIIGAVETSDNYDLDDADDDHLTLLEPEFRTVLLYAPSADFQAFAEFQLDGRAFVSKGDANDEKSEGHVRIEQLYLAFPNLTEELGVSIGRQRYKDARSWWYDDKIDTLRMEWRRDAWFATFSAGREKAFADDFAHEDTDEKVNFIIVTGGRYDDKRDQTTVFLISKDDRDSRRDEDPLFFGLQRVGEIGSDVRYWLDAALVRGHREDRRLRAYGIDTGFSMRFDAKWRPFVTLALAHGSGDNDLSDGVDGNFRQTDLEDNEARTFGITSYNYYGEVTDFELANMWIGTIGLGVRPDRDTSVELVYHRYRQADRDDDLFSSDLEIDPEGDNTTLGEEIDLIFAHRPNKKTKLSVTLGIFDPGDAFDRGADPAWLAKFKIAYRF